MIKKTDPSSSTRQFTPRATLAGIGLKLRSLKIFQPIEEKVDIHQKTVKHSPIDKLTDAFVTILAGAHGLVEVNTRLRSDPVLQHTFGREACAEQSVVQQTLNACTLTNVKLMEQATDMIFRIHGATSYGFASPSRP